MRGVRVRGETYPVRKELKQMGCYFVYKLGSWLVPLEKEAEALKIVDDYQRQRQNAIDKKREATAANCR